MEALFLCLWDFTVCTVLTIYAPVNLTALCIMVFMASPLRGGLGPGTHDICGPLEIARAVRRVPFGAHKYQVHNVTLPP